MHIKEKIGKRISESRNELGLTIRELAKKTKEFSAARISNWEHGTRSPGPTEAQVLSKTLGIAASYILCLTDDPNGEIKTNFSSKAKFIPHIKDSNDSISIANLKKLTKSLTPYASDSESKITLEKATLEHAGPHTFAFSVNDTAMEPILQPGDIVIADPDSQPQPGQLVIAHLAKANSNIVRKYRLPKNNAAIHGAFELVSENPDWGTTTIKNQKEGHIIAAVLEYRKYLVK